MSIGKTRRRLLRLTEKKSIDKEINEIAWTVFLSKCSAKMIRHYLSTRNHVRSLQH